MVCELTHQNIGSLKPELLEKHKQQFAYSKVFMRMGNRIMTFQMLLEKPKDKRRNSPTQLGHHYR